jgi:hypothetical protein
MNDTIQYIDKTMTELHRTILEETRKDEKAEQKVAIVVLVNKSGNRRITYAICEYGDGEGESSAQEFIDDCVENELLQEGESLELIVSSLELDVLE